MSLISCHQCIENNHSHSMYMIEDIDIDLSTNSRIVRLYNLKCKSLCPKNNLKDRHIVMKLSQISFQSRSKYKYYRSNFDLLNIDKFEFEDSRISLQNTASNYTHSIIC